MKFKIVTVWLAILLLVTLLYSMLGLSRPLNLTVIPQVPRENEPVIATFTIANPSHTSSTTQYSFYANGELLKTGTTTLAPGDVKTYQYSYENPLELGKQINFLLRANSDHGNYEEVVSLPSYPPQIMSSFVSFASFSTTIMTSMTSIAYYEPSFSMRQGMTLSAIFAVVLVLLLAYVELTRTRFAGSKIAILGRLRTRFSMLSWVLFIVFMGVVFTDITIIIST
ncbi:hypothetical protein ACFLTS_02895 [Chloroflexota bacterium]